MANEWNGPDSVDDPPMEIHGVEVFDAQGNPDEG